MAQKRLKDATDAYLLPISNLTQNALDGKADLIAGKIPVSQIPSIALISFLGTVSSQAQMLGLTGQRGDWCNRSDDSKTYVLTADNASILSNWQPINYPVKRYYGTENGENGQWIGTLNQYNALSSKYETTIYFIKE